MGSAQTRALACSADHDGCHAAASGAAISAVAPAGLAFVVVDGATEQDAGRYQMSVVY